MSVSLGSVRTCPEAAERPVINDKISEAEKCYATVRVSGLNANRLGARPAGSLAPFTLLSLLSPFDCVGLVARKSELAGMQFSFTAIPFATVLFFLFFFTNAAGLRIQ